MAASTFFVPILPPLLQKLNFDTFLTKLVRFRSSRNAENFIGFPTQNKKDMTILVKVSSCPCLHWQCTNSTSIIIQVYYSNQVSFASSAFRASASHLSYSRIQLYMIIVTRQKSAVNGFITVLLINC